MRTEEGCQILTILRLVFRQTIRFVFQFQTLILHSVASWEETRRRQEADRPVPDRARGNQMIGSIMEIPMADIHGPAAAEDL
jgi:hypothetical protein